MPAKVIGYRVCAQNSGSVTQRGGGLSGGSAACPSSVPYQPPRLSVKQGGTEPCLTHSRRTANVSLFCFVFKCLYLSTLALEDQVTLR